MRKILGLVSELAGLCVAAEHLLGIYPALRLLLAPGKEALEARADGFWCRRLGYGCDFVGDAGAEGALRSANLIGLLYAAFDTTGEIFAEAAGRLGDGREFPAVFSVPGCEPGLSGIRGA